jgi:hypothetical protein
MLRMAMMGVLVLAVAASAQTPPRWHWQPGQELTYKVEQSTVASDTVNSSKVETSNQMALTRRWQVVDVDSTGVATIHLKLLGLKSDITTPGGETLHFDSSNPDKSTAVLREQMMRFVGPTIAVLRVDGLGKVIEAKDLGFGPPTRYENELPFHGWLPEALPEVGASWQRNYQITLAPPQGTGEQFAALQTYRCKGISSDLLTVAVTTEMKAQPAALADRVPLLQLQPEGEFVFDLKAGRLKSATMKIDKLLQGHQGEASSHRFQSTYKEELVEN